MVRNNLHATKNKKQRKHFDEVQFEHRGPCQALRSNWRESRVGEGTPQRKPMMSSTSRAKKKSMSYVPIAEKASCFLSMSRCRGARPEHTLTLTKKVAKNEIEHRHLIKPPAANNISARITNYKESHKLTGEVATKYSMKEWRR